MGEPTYWLDLFTAKTWDEFHAAGGTTSGFSAYRWTTVQKMRPGDLLLCYLTGVSRFIGVLEVVGNPRRDDTPIWSDASFPSRIDVRIVHALTPRPRFPCWNFATR